MFNDLDSSPTLKKIRKPLLHSLSGPSKSRMMARNTHTIHPKISHPVVKKTLKVETTSTHSQSPSLNLSDTETIVDNHQDTQENSDDDNVPLAVLKDKLSNTACSSNKEPTSTSTKIHVFVSKTVGLIKQKQHRTFKCSKCDKRTNSLADLNTHYRGSHSRVKCKYCNQLFNTPSLC